LRLSLAQYVLNMVAAHLRDAGLAPLRDSALGNSEGGTRLKRVRKMLFDDRVDFSHNARIGNFTAKVKKTFRAAAHNDRIDKGGAMSHSTFASRVRGLRKAAGLNQPELAKKVGVTKALIGQIEAGKVMEVKMVLAFKLAAALGVSGRFLATGKGSPVPLGEISDEESQLIMSLRSCPPSVQTQIVATVQLFSRPEVQSKMEHTPIGLMHITPPPENEVLKRRT